MRTNGLHLLQIRLLSLNDSKQLAVMLKGKQYFVMEEIFLVNIRYFLSNLVNFFFHKVVSSPSPGNLIGKLLCLLVCLSPKAGPLRSFCVQITQMEIQVILLRQRNKHRILLSRQQEKVRTTQVVDQLVSGLIQSNKRIWDRLAELQSGCLLPVQVRGKCTNNPEVPVSSFLTR